MERVAQKPTGGKSVAAKAAVILGFAAAAIVLAWALIASPGGENQGAYITLGILFLAAVLFITELLPLAVTAMAIPIALALTGVLSPASAFLGFANDSVILFGGMFVIGGALFHTNVTATVGNFVVSVAKGNRRLLVLGVMLTTAVFSSVLSNTGTVAVLMPVCIGIADAAGWSRGKLLLPLAFSSSLGGMITLVGTPPNMTVNAVLQRYTGQSFGFAEFAAIGIPLMVVGILYLLFVGVKLLPDRPTQGAFEPVPAKEEAKPGDVKQQIIASSVLVGVIVVMMSGIISLHVAAVAGALICICTGIISEKDAVKSIDWTTIFLFSGTLALADALDQSGAGKLIADFVISIVGENQNGFGLMAVLFLITVLLTQFMSNTASCALLAPIGLLIAQGLGAEPKAVLVVIAIAASSAYATPIATPPNTLVTGPGGLKFIDFVKIGLPMIVITFLICCAIVPAVWPMYP